MIRRFAILLLTSLSLMQARVLIHGHRGARAVLPENTIPAFEYAIGVGVDVLELDLAVTKDDVLVVSHDAELNPAFCQAPPGARSHTIRELTLKEVKQFDCGFQPNPAFPKQKAKPGTRMPTLDEVFALAARHPKVEFNVETKIFAAKPQLTPTPERFTELVLQAIRRHKLERRVILQSFDFRTLRVMGKLAPEIRLSALLALPTQDFIASAKEAGATIVSPHFRLVTKEKVAAAQAAGLQVVPWTANTPAEWQPLLEAGSDAIITDDPAALITYLKQQKRP